MQNLEQARDVLGSAWMTYGDGKAVVREVNRAGRKDRHDRAVYSDRAVAHRHPVRDHDRAVPVRERAGERPCG